MADGGDAAGTPFPQAGHMRDLLNSGRRSSVHVPSDKRCRPC